MSFNNVVTVCTWHVYSLMMATCDVFFVLLWCTSFVYLQSVLQKKVVFRMHPLFSNVEIREIYHVRYLLEVVSLKEFFSQIYSTTTDRYCYQTEVCTMTGNICSIITAMH